MATYKEIRGTTVQNNAGDYTGAVDGQLWYNSTAGSFQLRVVTTAGAWATGGNLNTARGLSGSAGNKDAALNFGGEQPPQTAANESYNGSSWTEVNDLNTARQELAGTGTQTSALGFGGRQPAISSASESWNGTSWTTTSSLNTARRFFAGSGADNTSALGFGGVNSAPGGSSVGNTESWNGASWTEVNDLNTARSNLAGGGTNTDALAFGGTGLTESWNGTSWTEVNDLNTARSGLGGTYDTTNALAFGGSIPPVTAVTEEWNGTSWAETTDLNLARGSTNKGSSSSDSTKAILIGGREAPGADGTEVNATEEFTGAGVITETITTS